MLYKLFMNGKAEYSEVVSKKCIDAFRNITVYEMIFSYKNKKYTTNISVFDEVYGNTKPDTKQALLNLSPYIKKSKR